MTVSASSGSYQVVVIGAGPAGLGAAAQAAARGMRHVLLESSPLLANTIQRYQKGKHVMAEPAILPLRSPLPFAAGSRESILDAWDRSVIATGVQMRCGADVIAIKGERGNFTIGLRGGEEILAEHVVLAIGVQGNPRLLGVPGQELPCVQYQLDDPDEYSGENIVVVGAGDSAIENALALAKQNQVFVVNRRDDFDRAKEGNLTAIGEAAKAGRIKVFFNTTTRAVLPPDAAQAAATAGRHGTLMLRTPEGEVPVPVDRVIARLGAVPPRAFVESCGIVFPTAAANATPELSAKYESNVPGLYVVGALAGYPLIKQAINQGYEVVEHILGNAVQPADHGLLSDKFAGMPWQLDVDATLERIREQVPVLRPVNPLRFRELILESDVHVPARGAVVFRRNDYTSTFFSIVEGFVEVVIDEATDKRITIGKGNFFGEMGLISGRRRNATVYAGDGCVLVETPRRTMRRLIASNEEVKRCIDEAFILRAIHSQFAPKSRVEDLADIVRSAELRRLDAGEVLFNEGDTGDELHLVRSGSLTVSRRMAGRDVVLSYVPAGKYVGEMGLMGNTRRSATVRAAVPAETVVMKSGPFLALLDRDPALKEQVQTQVRDRLNLNARMESAPGGGDLISFLMGQGLGEATDVLLIDESLCVRCNNCEDACAGTHDGNSRLNREAGPTYAQIHVPTSCRHCEHPHCMKECPPDAISRRPNGEVVIADNCIGCGNCERNCPYGVIQMGYAGGRQPTLFERILFGSEAGKARRRCAESGGEMRYVQHVERWPCLCARLPDRCRHSHQPGTVC
jgi:CRP-like cAMP-binding protein/thioredoxin reductase/Fe-S-cluster-containing hydrogenase component 2